MPQLAKLPANGKPQKSKIRYGRRICSFVIGKTPTHALFYSTLY